MNTEPRCGKCGGAMQRGFLLDEGYGAKCVLPWIAGKPETSFWSGGPKTRKREQHAVIGYRCRGCGYLELFAGGAS